MARRTLVIGLGSTGATVCNNLMERIAWQYGSASSIPFVEFLGIDTDRSQGGGTDPQKNERVKRLTDDGRMIHICVDETSMNSLNENPSNWESTLGFQTWADTSVTNRMGAIDVGAGHIRMVGRLAFLFPSNLSRIHTAINSAVVRLSNLPAVVNAEWGRSNWQFNLDPGVVVYVVGTLCGGTASGSFIDLGYLLRQIQETHRAVQMTTIGLFPIPNPGHPEPAHTGNAYAALVELNHFSSDRTQYRQRINLPSVSELTKHNKPPYDFPYIVAPSEIGDAAVNELLVQCAQYVWVDALSPAGAARNAARVNICRDFLAPDMLGFNQRFMTFGTSSVEYPAHLIIQGCAYRLIANTLDALGARRDLAGATIQTAIKRCGLSDTDMATALQKRDGAPLGTLVRDRLEGIAGRWGSTSDLAELGRSIEKAFGVQNDAPALTDVYPNLIPDTLHDNIAMTRDNVLSKLRNDIRGAATDPSRGVTYCKALIDAAKTYVRNRSEAIKSSDLDNKIENARTSRNHCLGEIDVALQDFIIKMVLLENRVVGVYEGEYIDWSIEYFQLKLQKATEAAELSVLDQLSAEIQRLEKRLGNYGLLLANGARNARKKYEDHRDYLPLVSGKCLFDPGPGKTVDKEYDRQLLSQNPQEPAQMSLVADVLSSLTTDLLVGWDRDGYFDTRDVDDTLKYDGFTPEMTGLLEKVAGQSFVSLKDTQAITKVMGDTNNAAANVSDAWNASGLLLNVNFSDPNHYEHPLKSYDLVFFEGAAAACAGTALPMANNLATTLRPMVGLHGQAHWQDLDDPTQIVLLRERGSFPLRVMGGLEALAVAEEKFRYDSQLPTLHARCDVEWEPVSPPDRVNYENMLRLLLVGVALQCLQAPPSSADFEFELPARGFNGATKKPISRNLRAEALRLRSDSAFATELGDQIDQKIVNEGPAGILALVQRFLDGYANYAISGIEKSEAESILEQFCGTNPNLRGDYVSHLDVVPLAAMFREQDERCPSAGYYCPNHFTDRRCPVFWDALDKIPQWCPECQRKLRT